MAPASHRPRGGARGRGTGRGAPGKGGPGPSAHGPPFPGAPRAPWRLLAAKVPPTRAWPRRATAPGEAPGAGGPAGGRPGRAGRGPRARARLSPGAPRAPWRLLAAKVPPTRAWPRRATAPGEGPTKGPKGHKRGHRMSKGTQRPPKANQAAECQKVKRLRKVAKGT